jgi:octaprenyl-diphosphate synthase
MSAVAEPHTFTRPALDLPAIQALVAQDMAAVDALIRARLGSDVVLVNQVAEHIVAGGGKRLRPMLLLLAARALAGAQQADSGQADSEQADATQTVTGAEAHQLAAVDRIHPHRDPAARRRGRRVRPAPRPSSTANALFGNAASVLVGDYLYSRSFSAHGRAGAHAAS